ncbi:MAG: ATPase [Synergistaceae bacterium]|nr:ATPase [Synergistaceae bacterium]
MTDTLPDETRKYKVQNPEKLTSLKNLLFKKADDEREVLLDSARREAAEWVSERNESLDRMVDLIHGDAVKRSEEISKRQISGAEMTRTKDRLRLQNTLIDEAVTLFQQELIDLRGKREYPDILAGLALEAAEKLPQGSAVNLQLSSEDLALGSAVARRIREKRPDLTVTCQLDAAPILGGVLLSAPDGSWRAPADWQEIISGVKDTLAGRILPVL